MPEYKRETIYKTISSINGSILLPDIQRPFVWDEQQVYKLFDSLMRGYPISTFLFWELTSESIDTFRVKDVIIKMYKFVDSNEKENVEELSRSKDQYSLVLDGQQRLTSLFIALKGSWKKKSGKTFVDQELYFNALSGQIEDEDEDGLRFQFQFMEKNTGKVKFDSEGDRQYVWVNVKRIYEANFRTAEKHRAFVSTIIGTEQILDQDRYRLADNISDLNQVLKNGLVISYFPEDEADYEKVLDIFVRTNAGGTKLGYSDLLFSKIKLRWSDARGRFKELLDGINKRNFEFETDFLLKTCLTLFSEKAEDVRYNISNLNNALIDKICSGWEDICSAIQNTVDLLEEFLITDKKQLPSYNALIPIIYWNFKNPKNRNSELASDHKKSVRVWLTKALLSGAFSGQSDTTLYKCKQAIDSSCLKMFPALDIEKNIKTMKNRSMELGDEFFDQLRYNSKESYLFLSLCYNMAINFQPKHKGNLPEQDHIFSKDELTKAKVEDAKINSIYNIRYVTLNDNRSKKDTPFAKWVEELGEQKDVVFTTHHISKKAWTVDEFDKFLETRKQKMLEMIKYATS